jgi:hypothetical protein
MRYRRSLKYRTNLTLKEKSTTHIYDPVYTIDVYVACCEDPFTLNVSLDM